MPFVSENQRKFMYARHPDIAKRWSKEQGKLPAIKRKLSKYKKPDGYR